MFISLSFAATNVSDCGVISSSGEYELNVSVGSNTSSSTALLAGSFSCIYINSSDVSFSCNGFNVDANGASSADIGIGAGISAGPVLTNITIMNCPNITNYSFSGVYIRNIENSTVTNNTFFANYNGITFRQNLNLTITNNTGRNNNNSGFDIPATVSNATFENNVAHDNEIGFDASKGGVNLTFTNNYAYNNTDKGFIITGTEGATLTNNTATQNDIGFSLTPFQGSSFNVTDNLADLNRNGFEIYTFQSFLTNNSAISNTENGLSVQSANESIIYSMYFSDNTVDLFMNESLGDLYSVDFSSLVFDSPTGGYTNYTNISFEDSVDANTSYEFFWSATPSSLPSGYTSFNNMYLNITNLTENVSIDTISWFWLDSQSSGLNESRLRLFDYNGSTWADTSATLNDSANYLSLTNLSSFSTFGVFSQNIAPATSPGGRPNSPLTMSGSMSSSCSVNQFTMSADGPITIIIDDERSGVRYYEQTSGSSNSVEFTAACGSRVIAYATKSNYRPYHETFDLIDCSLCQVPPPNPGNTTNPNNPPNPGNNTNGSNTNNPSNPTTPSGGGNSPNGGGCTSDTQCSSSQMCSSGTCVPVSGSCGRVSNHTFIPYECGEGIGCMLCPTGFRCESNICLRNDLIANDSGFVGEQIVVHVNEYTTNETRNCNNCDLVIIDSTGRTFSGRTNSVGNYTLPLEIVGEYRISLVYGNATIKRISVQALPREPVLPTEPAPVSWLDILASYWWLLLLLLLLIAYLIYRRQQTGSRKR